ncbi:response regulator transcription factor [Klebsiella variicola]|uniref:response regulator transcription factor n=1 Tax=Klebsiella variicola TaxID=244366 RepID=UPI000D747305|nr:response regulator transcription factor [Klebsiella variicola]PXL17014.1 DNA-binding response regulator [Klebsiella variicola]PXL41669.1 DNA-binding response regulator [Klebsiella variicola]PXL62961.1 DNA-binding response regulator [Klebsiella variicola]
MSSVLCVEDDEFFAREIIHALTEAGISARHVITAAEAISCLEKESYDLITLDRVLPDLDGIELLKKLRAINSETPVIMISGMSSVEDRVSGISAGCQDYIVKPFSSEEVVARILVHLRFNKVITDTSILNAEGIQLDLIEKTLSFGKVYMPLKSVEFRLMTMLMRNHGILITRPMILESVWGYKFDPGTKVIDVHINNLRKKLDELGSPLKIINLRGAGFIFKIPENDEESI